VEEVVVIQQVWSKFNANERMASIGAGLVLVAFVLGIVFGGFLGLGGTGVVGILAAIALVVVYYLKYAPDTKITWPAPIPVIAFAIGGITGVVALLAILSILGIMGVLAAYGGITYLLAPVVNVVGAAMMGWFTYKEWQAYKASAPVAPPPAQTYAPPAPPAAPPAPPAAPPAPPAAPPAGDAQ
jgi:hypothetical protein